MKIILTFLISLSFTAAAGAQTFNGKKKDIDRILDNIAAFSQAYMAGDYDAIAGAYTPDGKIFPNNTPIIEGREAIRERWVLPEGVKILLHRIDPVEITVVGNTAYDHGYYSGETLTKKGDKVSWKGKYVIVWKKTGGEWKIYLDIWNRVKDEDE